MKKTRKAATEWNDKELKMLKAMPLDEPITILEMAKACFSSVGTAPNKRGNSWVRNSIRKPLRLKFVRQLGRGLYMKVKPESPTATAKKATRSKKPKFTKKARTNSVPMTNTGATEAAAVQ